MGKVLEYQSGISLREIRVKRMRTFMVWVYALSLLLATVLIFHPLMPMFPFQEAFGGGSIGTPLAPMPGQVDEHSIFPYYAPYAFLYFGLFVLSQWLFLKPRGEWRISMTRENPVTIGWALAAAFIGMLICIGLLATVLELLDDWAAMTLDPEMPGTQHFGAIWIVMAICWAAWTVVFYFYYRSLDRYTAITRVFRALLGGTILELVITTPAHAWIVHTRDERCYCEYGTYTGMAFGVTAALWLFGPGTLLLFMREKNRGMNLIPPPLPPPPEKML